MKYITIEETKLYLGFSGTSKNARLSMCIMQAEEMVEQILGGPLYLRKILNEPYSVAGARRIRLHQRHPIAVDSIDLDGSAYEQDEPYDFDAGDLILENYVSAPARKTKITYAAGWNAGGMATIKVLDNSQVDAGETVTISIGSDDLEVTEGDEWEIGATETETAESLAGALDDLEGIAAFNIGSTVYVVDRTPQRASCGLTTNVAAEGFELSGSKLAGVDLPQPIRGAIMIYAGDLMNRAKNGKVKSYTIGSKQVTFASDSDASLFTSMLAPYQRSLILGI